MMSPMFTPAAVACLVDGRLPRPEEVDEMAAKIWRESYWWVWKIEWSEVERSSRLYASIYAAALTALGSMVQFGPEVMKAAV